MLESVRYTTGHSEMPWQCISNLINAEAGTYALNHQLNAKCTHGFVFQTGALVDEGTGAVVPGFFAHLQYTSKEERDIVANLLLTRTKDIDCMRENVFITLYQIEKLYKWPMDGSLVNVLE